MEKLTFQDIKSYYQKYVLDVYSPYDVVFEYGTGELLFDVHGKKYIDFSSGISVTNLGHSDSDIIDTITHQIDKLIHTSNLFYSLELAKLSQILIEYSFPGKVFFCNSGTEANELAFKLIKRYGEKKNQSDGIVLTLDNSFHGRTIGSMSLTGQEKIKDGFGQLVSNVIHVPPNDESYLFEIFERYENQIIGLIVEPILGEGGIIPLDISFLNLCRQLSSNYNSILVFDEIQTGIGRTGSLFYFEHLEFLPDIITIAKGLGSGFPIGAVIISEPYEDILEKGMHGSTFGGNHLACSIAYETIKQIISREILKQVNSSSNIAFKTLENLKQKYPNLIREVRGKGLHIGIEMNVQSRNIAEQCLKEGLVINATAENVIRIMPPLNIKDQFLIEGLEIFEKILKKSEKI